MTARKPDHELARHLLESESGGHDEPAEAVAAAERVLQRMHEHLARWFGPDGIHALLSRALAEARDAHPALADVQIARGRVFQLKGLTVGGVDAGDLAWRLKQAGYPLPDGAQQ